MTLTLSLKICMGQNDITAFFKVIDLPDSWKVIVFYRICLLLVITYLEFWTIELFIQIAKLLLIERIASNH